MKKKLLLVATILCVFTVLLFTVSCNSGDSNADYSGGAAMDAAPEENKNSVAGDSAYVDPQKVVKNASVTAETMDYADATDKLKALISANGVIVSSSNTKVEASYYSSDDMLRTASYTLKVPSEKFDAFLDGLDEFLNITYITTSTEDVSDAYYDLEAVIETLNAKRDSLLEMLNGVDSKTNFSYWRQLSEELASIETQIARYEAQMNALSSRINYSTVTLSLREVGELTETEEKGYFADLGESLVEGFGFVLDFFKGLLIVLVYLFPFAFIGGAIFTVIFLSVRRKRRRNALKKASATPAPQSAPTQSESALPAENQVNVSNTPYGSYRDR